MLGKVLYADLRGWPAVPIFKVRERAWEYRLVRHYRPKVMIETGVYRGGSSAIFLSAMERNRAGRLISIDRPRFRPETNADGQEASYHVGGTSEVGELVPPRLRSRWTLLLEDARVALPRLLADLQKAGEPLDAFYHDSDHTFEHMMFEFRTAWASLRSGGVLASDDINWNESFPQFAREVGVTPTPTGLPNRGLLVKP